MTPRDVWRDTVTARVELGARVEHDLTVENSGHRWLRANEIGHRADKAHKKERT